MAIDWQAIAEAGGIAKGPSKYERAVEDARSKSEQRKTVYELVNDRDQMCCRVCQRYCPTNAIGVLDRGHHHHLVYRSAGGRDETWNVCLLCPKCHDAEHKSKLQISGNADERDPATGKLNGIKLEKLGDGQWVLDRWC
jgi:5-methylcytosine-specific restriction endonuclease McrA